MSRVAELGSPPLRSGVSLPWVLIAGAVPIGVVLTLGQLSTGWAFLVAIASSLLTASLLIGFRRGRIGAWHRLTVGALVGSIVAALIVLPSVALTPGHPRHKTEYQPLDEEPGGPSSKIEFEEGAG